MRLLKPMIIAAVLVLMVVLAGCAKQAAPAPAAPAEPVAPVPPAEEPAAAPEAPQAPAEEAATARRPAAGNVETVGEETARKADYRWDRKQGVSSISNINCEMREDNSVTFTFTVVNEDGPSALGEQNPLAGVAGAQLSVNGQRLKGNRVADACGEDALMLDASESFTCVVESVLRRNAVDGTQKVQSIEFEALDYTSRHQFKCAE